MRFTIVSMATNTQDVRLPVDMVDPYTNEAFTPKWTTTSGGYTVADAIQSSPKDAAKKMVSGFGAATGVATPTAETPVVAAPVAPAAEAPAPAAEPATVAAAAPAPAAVTYASLTGDVAKGEMVFAQCKACHVVALD